MQFRKTTTKFIAGLLLVNTMLTPALAATGVVNADGSSLRVRAEANTNSQVLYTLANGTKVDVLSVVEGINWYEIAIDGVTGYVTGDFLDVTGEVPSSAPAAETPAQPAAETPAAEPAAAPTPKAFVPFYVRVDADSLNVRSAPATDSDRVGKLADGKVVQVLGEENGWYKIENGYISAEFTAPSSAEEAKSNNSLTQQIVDYGLSFVGSRYVYGGSSPKGFDCSGFTKYVYNHFGYKLNRSASDQLNNGRAVGRNELQPGDLVMFKHGKSSKRATHVGLYIGNNQFVHASTARVGVIVSSMNDYTYNRDFVGGRRII